MSEKSQPVSVPPSLVLFDTKTNLYSHFIGKTKTCEIRASWPMDAEMLEEFRVNPLALLGEDGDQLA